MLTEEHIKHLEHDVAEFQKYGGRIIQVAPHPTVAGDKTAGKWKQEDPLLKKIGWKKPDSPNNLRDINDIKKVIQSRNIGVTNTDPWCTLACIDCDADDEGELKKDTSGDPYDPFAEMYERTLVIYTDDPETKRFKSFFAIKDPENMEKFIAFNASTKGRTADFEVFFPGQKWLVIAPSIHGLKLLPIVSNGRDIDCVFAEEFADIVEGVTGMSIREPLKCRPSPETQTATQSATQTETQPATQPTTPKKQKALKMIPSVEELMKPLLRNPRPGKDGWINGIITDGNGINAGYNTETQIFVCHGTKGKWGGQRGGKLTAFAIINDLQFGSYNAQNCKWLEDRPRLDDVWLKNHGYSPVQGENGYDDRKWEEFAEVCKNSATEVINKELEMIKSTPDRDVLNYLATVVNLEHVGDTAEIKLLLMSLMMRYDVDSRGSIIFVGGSRGSGKSDLVTQIVNLFPEWERMSQMVSPKALWYEPIVPKTIFTIEEQEFTDDFQDFVKLSQSNWDKKEGRIVTVSTSKGMENVRQSTPIRMQIISVRATQTGDEQVANRGFSITLTETPEKKKALIDLMNRDRSEAHRRNEAKREECRKRAETILMRLPNSFRCNFPFEITYPDYISSDPRQMRIFNSLVAARALLRQAYDLTQQEYDDTITIEAAECDFWDVLDVINGCYCTSLKRDVSMRAGVGNQIVDTLKSIKWGSAECPIPGVRCIGDLMGEGKQSYAVPYEALSDYLGKDKSSVRKALNGRRPGDPNAIVDHIEGFSCATAGDLALEDVHFRQLKSNWLVVTPGYWKNEQLAHTGWAITPRGVVT